MYRNLSPEEFLKNPARFHVIDVRSQEEWDSFHEAGAIHVPLIGLEERAGELPKDRPLVLVCRTGGRSARAAQMLGRLGFDARNLMGGLRMLAAARAQNGQIGREEALEIMRRLG